MYVTVCICITVCVSLCVYVTVFALLCVCMRVSLCVLVCVRVYTVCHCVCVCVNVFVIVCVSESGRLDPLQPIEFFGQGRRVYVIDVLMLLQGQVEHLQHSLLSNSIIILCPALKNFQLVFVVCTCSLLRSMYMKLVA